MPDARVLDLFAGTGAYGIEALSRGAKSALFIEQSPRTAEALQQNLTSLEYSFPVLTSPVENWLPKPKISTTSSSSIHPTTRPEQSYLAGR